MRTYALILVAFLLSGCVHAPAPQKGGSFQVPPLGSSKPMLVEAPENTLSPATVRQLETTAPAGTHLTVKSSSNPGVLHPFTAGTTTTEDFTFPSNTVIRIQELSTGTNQKDDARTLWAKALASLETVKAQLASMQPIMYIGIVLCLFGVASLVYPPLRLIIGSVTTSMVIGITGLCFMVLPVLVVGHQLLILCFGLAAIVLYVFAHRHGQAVGAVKTLTTQIENLP